MPSTPPCWTERASTLTPKATLIGPPHTAASRAHSSGSPSSGPGISAPQVCFHHHSTDLLYGGARLPTQFGPGPGGVAHQDIHLCWAKETGIHGHFRSSGTRKLQGYASNRERHTHKVAHGLLAAGCQHVGTRPICLHHLPHSFDVLGRKTPVATRIQVAQFEHPPFAMGHAGHRIRYLACHKFTSPKGAFMVEQNAADGIHAISFPVVDGHPVGKQLGHRIRAARTKGGGLALRRLTHPTEHL